MDKGNLFFADGFPPFNTGGIETHGIEYIKSQGDGIKPYSFLLKDMNGKIQETISKYRELSRVNFTLPFESTTNPEILNTIFQKHSPDFTFFNSLYWIKVTDQLKKTNRDVRFILRSGGNDIAQSNIQNFPTLEERRNFIVEVVNNSIDLLVVNSKFTFNQFLSFGIREDKMKVVIGGVDVKKFSPATNDKRLSLRKKLGIPTTSIVGLSVSRLVDFKNIPAILEVAKNIVTESGNIFIIVGGGPLFETTRHFIEKNYLSDKVLLTGDVPNQEIVQYYQLADYFLQMSTYSNISVPSTKEGGEKYVHTETMGRGLMEAMSVGLPIVTTSVGGVPEVIGDGGILIPDKDIYAAIRAIQWIIANPDNRSLSHRAMEIAKGYDWKYVFNSY